MVELRIYEAGVCSGCGYHKSLTGDLDNHFAIEVEHCNVCAGVAKNDRIQQAADRKALKAMGDEDKIPPTRKRPGDGRHVMVQFRGRKTATAEHAEPPEPGSASQSLQG
ncbi:hypothetical protein GUY44_07385 [Pimelobacter simplex]|uniref:Uncharacterized protein n=1 Tax=Nocardioides simplex TaxID=2045 RepID=A0A0A1DGW5_NOCSI|nr:hypothetical protein [Pimelobacter simplex]AIY15847.1 hypothetical protein KR76_01990 [Pimelobacter simplex]MCG8150296.1 hypothetical protein [Pimelobacter simplex]GEB16661.1 hypothetical protein NSI01_49760 [Pimelobacter simplex]SFM90392.1 hypothetical protein SAMN05421671_4122 [Pimelobacter simplex]